MELHENCQASSEGDIQAKMLCAKDVNKFAMIHLSYILKHGTTRTRPNPPEPARTHTNPVEPSRTRPNPAGIRPKPPEPTQMCISVLEHFGGQSGRID